MIRIYLDWNVFSNLKNEEFLDFKKKILSYKTKLLFPYSPAHFHDLMKSYSPENKMFWNDINTLDEISEKHLLRWEKEKTNYIFCKPSQYFQSIKDNYNEPIEYDINNLFDKLDESGKELGLEKHSKMLKTLLKNQIVPIDINDKNRDVLNQMFPNLKPDSNMLEFLEDIGLFFENFVGSRTFYKEFRKTLNEKGFKVEANSGNWDEKEVVKNINTYLNSLGTNLTFTDYVHTAFKYRKQPATRFAFFKTAYLFLDMIGYKSDKLKKPTDTAKNIVIDSEHAFYGAHCDYFVVIDKNLRIKSKVLYSEFKIPTKVLSFEEFREILDDLIHISPNSTDDIVENAFKYIDFSKVVEKYEKSEECKSEILAMELPILYFNFFNYVILQKYIKNKVIVLTYRRVFKNYSNAVYFTELDNLFQRIDNLVQFDRDENFEKNKQEFIFGQKDISFKKCIKYGMLILEKETHTNRAVLQYYIKIE